MGIQTHGLQPMKLPADINAPTLAHMINERIPIEAIEFESEAVYQVLQRFGEK